MSTESLEPTVITYAHVEEARLELLLTERKIALARVAAAEAALAKWERETLFRSRHEASTASSVASRVSTPFSASSRRTSDTHSTTNSPLPMDHLVLLSPPPPSRTLPSVVISTSTSKRSRISDSRRPYAPSIYTSTDSAGGSDAAPPRPKKSRRHHSLLVTAKGTKVQVASSQRHHWLYQGHCARDRSRPINHRLKLPPAYFSELDELAALDSPSMSLRPVTEEWQSQQPEVVHHVTNVLLTHSYKVSCALAGTSMQRSKDRRRVAAHLGGSSPSSDSDSEHDSPSTRSRGRSKHDSPD